MNDRESDSDDLHSCPHLGLASAPSLRRSSATSSHRCFRWPTPQPVDDRQQMSFCLADYPDCDWFVTARELAEPRRANRSLPLGSGKLLGLVALALAIVVGLALFRPWSLVAPASSSSGGGPAVSETATPSGVEAVATPSPSATPEATPSPTESPTPNPAPTRAAPAATAARATVAPVAAPATATPRRATATATPVPPTPSAVRTATPPAPVPSPVATAPPAVRVYTVREGDSLSSIAGSFGVTVGDLMKANGLAEGSTPRVGQPLVVPAGR
ncbi:MAG: LysM peptidoglycan-binding domain-containing protein [Chloroflexota bacterium]